MWSSRVATEISLSQCELRIIKTKFKGKHLNDIIEVYSEGWWLIVWAQQAKLPHTQLQTIIYHG